ncbi:hypothetical protein LOD99_2312 [Oopsacas minuta]|uniref:TIP41-like protein n=1 Tax=Oopsacas minuta TaxID=111878 RepID=A0AAV7K1F2_9METZ|nr:hypothetical protein LOD99_2312 [Oopsacas minuta]
MASNKGEVQEPINESLDYGNWKFLSRKSHILNSKCTSNSQCESVPVTTSETDKRRLYCDHCCFAKLLELPELPEMCFPQSFLIIEHCSGVRICFAAFDALQLVDAHNDKLKVQMAEKWKEERSNTQGVGDVVHPFDWTYTTEYTGTIVPNPPHSIKIELTEEQINLEKLKQQEKILFYNDIILFEDELADNGVSILRVKIRVMTSCFFILLRQFLRVDGVLIRVNEARYYHEKDSKYILREISCREGATKDIHPTLHTQQDEVARILPVKLLKMEKLMLP